MSSLGLALSPVALPGDCEIILSTERKLSASFTLTNKLVDILDHFPGEPIVAGYMQLIWLEHLMCKVVGSVVAFDVLDIKFIHKISIPSVIKIEMSWDVENTIYRFILSDEFEVKTKGRLKITK